MPRAKKQKPVEVEPKEREMDLEAEIDEAAELSLDEETTEEEVSEETVAEVEAEKAPKAKREAKPKATPKPRVRKPRARKKAEPVASLLKSMSTSADETPAKPEVAVVGTEIPSLSTEPEVKIEVAEVTAQIAAEPDATMISDAAPEAIREDVAIASVSIHQSMDNMAKQWGTVKEISSSVCASLERVNTMLKEVPAQGVFKAPVARPAAITKIAVGFSVLSIVLSGVSLLLSQSARQAIFDRPQAPAVVDAKRVSSPLPKEYALPKPRPSVARPPVAFAVKPPKVSHEIAVAGEPTASKEIKNSLIGRETPAKKVQAEKVQIGRHWRAKRAAQKAHK